MHLRFYRGGSLMSMLALALDFTVSRRQAASISCAKLRLKRQCGLSSFLVFVCILAQLTGRCTKLAHLHARLGASVSPHTVVRQACRQCSCSFSPVHAKLQSDPRAPSTLIQQTCHTGLDSVDTDLLVSRYRRWTHCARRRLILLWRACTARQRY